MDSCNWVLHAKQLESHLSKPALLSYFELPGTRECSDWQERKGTLMKTVITALPLLLVLGNW